MRGITQKNRAGLPAAFVAVLAVASLVGSARPAFATGSEERRGDPAVGLSVLYDTRWGGNGFGGYYPVRVLITNTGDPASVSLHFRPEREMLPTVEMAPVDVANNATVFKTLLIPMTGPGTRGHVVVRRNGEERSKLTLSITLPDVPRGLPQPSLLIISPNLIDATHFTQATATAAGGDQNTVEPQIVPPARLPTNWLAYSGLDFVAVSLEDLGRLPAEQRATLLQWVDTGGNLIVFSVGEKAAESERLAELLGQAADDAADSTQAEAWQPADPGIWKPVVLAEPADPYGYTMPAAVEEEPAEPVQVVSEWGVEGDTFQYRDRLLGRVFAFPENPFPGSISDWSWVLNTLGTPRGAFPYRTGAAGRRPSAGFLQFLIEGVSGVPVYAFLILMTLVTIAIGPVNYIVLRRRRQVYMLLLTIPALALATSVTLFAYSLLAHGFDVKSRVRSVTFLDQPRDTAVSVSRVALFAGLAPSEGLTFSPETAVVPIWSSEDAITSGRVVWGGQQTFAGGWFRSRTRTQFYTTTHRAQRGHLEMTPAADGTLRVANGLEWDIQTALVADKDGTLYHIGELPAGAEGVARRAESLDVAEVRQLFHENAPEGPQYAGSYSSNPYGRGYYDYYGGYMVDTYSPSESRIEHILRSFQQPGYQQSTGAHGEAHAEQPGGFQQPAGQAETLLEPNTYLAILNETPDLDIGLDDTTERGGFHVLLGRY